MEIISGSFFLVLYVGLTVMTFGAGVFNLLIWSIDYDWEHLLLGLMAVCFAIGWFLINVDLPGGKILCIIGGACMASYFLLLPFVWWKKRKARKCTAK